MNGKELLQKAHKTIENVYKAGYNEGLEDGNISGGTLDEKIKEAYENGANDAWECAKKIETPTVEGGLSGRELALIFKDGATLYKVFKNYSAREAVTRIKEYEEEQKKAAEIKIGDEVTDNDGWNGVVTFISPNDRYLVVTLQDGNALRWKKESFKKTGRHFPQIDEVLKQMQEGNE